MPYLDGGAPGIAQVAESERRQSGCKTVDVIQLRSSEKPNSRRGRDVAPSSCRRSMVAETDELCASREQPRVTPGSVPAIVEKRSSRGVGKKKAKREGKLLGNAVHFCIFSFCTRGKRKRDRIGAAKRGGPVRFFFSGRFRNLGSQGCPL